MMDAEPRLGPLILIADDDPDSRTVLALLLHGDGYETRAVSGSAEALVLLEVLQPALVIADYHMPHMNGLGLFAEMRKDPRHRGTPVILFSADDGAREAALGAGVSAFVVKGSMDFAALQREVLRFAGPGTLEKKLPDVPPSRAKEAG